MIVVDKSSVGFVRIGERTDNPIWYGCAFNVFFKKIALGRREKKDCSIRLILAMFV